MFDNIEKVIAKLKKDFGLNDENLFREFRLMEPNQKLVGNLPLDKGTWSLQRNSDGTYTLRTFSTPEPA